MRVVCFHIQAGAAIFGQRRPSSASLDPAGEGAAAPEQAPAGCRAAALELAALHMSLSTLALPPGATTGKQPLPDPLPCVPLLCQQSCDMQRIQTHH
jgi:hypothetical protein